MLILSNPHNPVGRAWRADELIELASICLENGIIILSDEIHSDLVLHGHKHTPVASLSEEIAQITITCMAPSKTFNLAGMATSSLIIPNPELLKIFNSVVDRLHIGMGNLLGTEASIAAYKNGSEWLSQLLDYLQGNVNFVAEYLSNNIKTIKPIIPEATYMMWLDCRDLKMNGEALSHFFIEEAGLGLNEGSSFGDGGEGYMRLNLACPREVLERAMKSLQIAVNNFLNRTYEIK
jgi:cystathionine beta-lyase